LSIAGDALHPSASQDATIHLVPDLGVRRRAVTANLAVSGWVLGPERPWTGVASSYRRALRALDRYGPGPRVVDTEEHLADLVLLADPEARADLREQVLRPFATLKPAAAERLAQTLLSWVLHQGRRDDVARELVVHPQTVRYHMGQIRELFGEQITDPRVVRDLVVALSND